MQQRTGAVASTSVSGVPAAEPGQTEEEPGPEPHHSARNLQAAPASSQSRKPEQRRVKWPAANEKDWHQFDEDLDTILESTCKGNVEQKLHTMCTLTMGIGAVRFGVTEKRGTTIPSLPNQREVKISQLRQDLRSLKRQYKAAKEEERMALAELREVVRRRLTTLRQAEWHRKKGKERDRKCRAFISNPFASLRDSWGRRKAATSRALWRR